MFNPLAHSIDKAVFLRALLKIIMPKASAKTPYEEPVNFDEEKFAADVEERSLLYDKGEEDYRACVTSCVCASAPGVNWG